MKKVAVFIQTNKEELHPVGLELLSEVKRQLSDKAEIYALLISDKINQNQIDQVSKCGADKIITCVDTLLKEYDTSYFTTVITSIENKYKFDVLLLGSTLLGRDLGPRLSARLHTGLTADATSIDFEVLDEKIKLLATRPALGGNLFATIVCETSMPQMATVRPGIFHLSVVKETTSEVINHEVELKQDSQVKIIKKVKLDKQSSNLTSAKIIVAGGRGVATIFDTVRTFANSIGAEVAASRAVIDADIETKERLVGQTGHFVKPSVYIALGISGAIQHVSGMDKSELIIAINNDPTALIFNVADVSLVVDAHQVLPILNNELKLIKTLK